MQNASFLSSLILIKNVYIYISHTEPCEMFSPADSSVATEDWDWEWEVRAFLHIHGKKRNRATIQHISL